MFFCLDFKLIFLVVGEGQRNNNFGEILLEFLGLNPNTHLIRTIVVTFDEFQGENLGFFSFFPLFGDKGTINQDKLLVFLLIEVQDIEAVN